MILDGDKICFTNIVSNPSKEKVIDINDRCKQDDVDWRYEYEVGYGRVKDRNGDIYGVKLYYTRQKSMF